MRTMFLSQQVERIALERKNMAIIVDFHLLSPHFGI